MRNDSLREPRLRLRRMLAVGSLIFGGVAVGVILAWMATFGQYAAPRSRMAGVERPLRFFVENASKHASDPVAGCWYDAGNYVTFFPHQLLATWYLEFARSVAAREETRAALTVVINQSLSCLRPAMAEGWKQFRDESSHGIPLPPWLHERFFPQQSYQLAEGEGRDMWLIWSHILKAEGASAQTVEAAYEQGLSLARNAMSEACCEAGPLGLSSDLVAPFTARAAPASTASAELWGAQPAALAALAASSTRIPALFKSLSDDADISARFRYWGGNRDLVGTVALERLYARKTGDGQFYPLSARIMRFVDGDNPWRIPFTDDPALYHPCVFFRVCPSADILASGLDPSEPREPWRMHEPTIVGQAVYVLALVLWNGW